MRRAKPAHHAGGAGAFLPGVDGPTGRGGSMAGEPARPLTAYFSGKGSQQAGCLIPGPVGLNYWI